MELKEGQKFKVLESIWVKKIIPKRKTIEIVSIFPVSTLIWVDKGFYWIDKKDLLEHIKQKRLKQVI